MMTRFYVPLTQEEFVSLTRLANQNLRKPQDQARYILRNVLMNEPSAEMSKPAIAESLGNSTYFDECESVLVDGVWYWEAW